MGRSLAGESGFILGSLAGEAGFICGAGFCGARVVWILFGPPWLVGGLGCDSENRTLSLRLSLQPSRASRLTTSSTTPLKRSRTLTCFSTLTTRPIILISSAVSVSEGPLSPFSRAFRSPGLLPTIWSTLQGKGKRQRARTHTVPPSH